MNTRLIALTLSAALASTLTSCVDQTAGASGSSTKQSTPTLVITKPARVETATLVAETLRDAFTQTAQASGGANVPNPHVSIIQSDGTVLDVPAPKVDGGVFGENSPKAKQQRLQQHLEVIARELAKDCSGKPVSSGALNATQNSPLKAGGFDIWSTTGTTPPWKDAEKAIGRVHPDRDAFVKALAEGTSKPFLILADMPAPTKDRKLPVTKVAKAEAPGAVPQPPAGVTTQSASAQSGTPGGDKIDIHIHTSGDKRDPGGRANASPATLTPPGLNPTVSAPSPVPAPVPVQNEPEPIKPTRTRLPKGVEPVGKPFLFAPGVSKLTSEDLAALKDVAASLRADPELRQSLIFVVGKADHTLDKEFNVKLATERATAVKTALWEEGVAVEDLVSVGEDLCPDDAPKAALAAYRSVQVYALRATRLDEADGQRAALSSPAPAPRP